MTKLTKDTVRAAAEEAYKSVMGQITNVRKIVTLRGGLLNAENPAENAFYEQYIANVSEPLLQYLSAELVPLMESDPSEALKKMERLEHSFAAFLDLNHSLENLKKAGVALIGKGRGKGRPLNNADLAELKACMRNVENSVERLNDSLTPFPIKIKQALYAIVGVVLGFFVGPFKYACVYAQENSSLGSKIEGLIGGFIAGPLVGAKEGYDRARQKVLDDYNRKHPLHAGLFQAPKKVAEADVQAAKKLKSEIRNAPGFNQ